MDRYKHKTADALSGGQKQRVAIARAIVKGSDIILADEPTGNLDSENTTIIMDILKEISKKQLVVLVTHEVNLIYKYADSHIKLVDGELKEDGTLDEEIEVEVEKNNIYVNEEQKRIYKADDTNINVYGESIKTDDIEIIGDNGNVYIRPGKGVTVLNNKSEKQIIFEGSKEAKKEKEKFIVPEFSKSTAEKNGRLFTLRNVWKSTKYNSGEKAYSTSNIFKQIFIFVIAVVIAFFSMFTFEASSSKLERKVLNDNSVYLDMRSYPEVRKLKEELYDNIDFFELNYRQGSFSYNNQQSMSAVNVKYVPKALNIDKNDNLTIEFGKMPQTKEVLITRKLADKIKHELRKKEFQSDEAVCLTYFEKKYKVSGIVRGNEPAVYFNRADYVNFLGVYKEVKFTDSNLKFFDKKFINKDTKETINNYKAEICLYVGQSLTLQNNEAVVEINRSSTYLMMNDSKDADYKIDSVNRILLKTPQYISIVNSYPMYIRQFNLNRDEMDTDIKIYVNKHTLNNIFTYIAPNLDALDKQSSYFFEINTTSEEQLNQLSTRLTERSVNEIDIEALYDKQNKELVNKAVNNLAIFIVVILLLFIIFYFIEKSNSIQNSKEYGIFRAIGVNKSNLLFKEVILSFKNNLIGYLISFVIVISVMGVRYGMMNVAVGNFIGISIGIMLLSSLIMTAISLIPYLFVLTKTPSEILSKYDI